MKGDDRVIEFLNDHLTAELTIISQYFLTAKLLANWGLPGLGRLFRDMSFDEMRDAENLIDRIIFLEGHPNLQRLRTIEVGEDPHEQMTIAVSCEKDAIDRLRRGVDLCHEVGDHATGELAARMLIEQEGHLDRLETQLEAIERVGLQNYLSSHLALE